MWKLTKNTDQETVVLEEKKDTEKPSIKNDEKRVVNIDLFSGVIPGKYAMLWTDQETEEAFRYHRPVVSTGNCTVSGQCSTDCRYLKNCRFNKQG